MPQQWQKNIVKRKRNLGEKYVSANTKREVAARKIGNPCNDGCFVKVGMPVIQEVFNNYWSIGEYNLQNSCLQGSVREVPIKRKRTTKEVSRRTCNYSYIIRHNGFVHSVCRKGFIAIHGISEKKLRYTLSAAKVSASGTTLQDKRGSGPSSRKITGVKLQRVHDHIRLIPVQSSHYTRAKSPNRKYIMDDTCSIKKLYRKYIDWMTE